MNDLGIGTRDDGTIDTLADQRVVDAERFDSDADQSGADADQIASDQDQAAADQDEAQAARDQQTAEGDQARADWQRLSDAGGADLDANEALRLALEQSTISRLSAHVARARTARLRAETAAQRDAMAAARDETAQRRDVREEARGHVVAASDAPLAEKLEQVRARAAAARARSAAARSRAAAGEDRAAQDEDVAARERARLEADLHGAHIDDLTGAYRREMGRLALIHEIDRARRADGRFVLAFVDIDGMKRVNDREGHAAGDQVLKTLASTLRSNLRSFDPIVRYGGDEFVCGLGGVDHDVVARRFDAICRSVRDTVGVGVSVGLAALAADETLDQLTSRADARLLEAKRRGGKQRVT